MNKIKGNINNLCIKLINIAMKIKAKINSEDAKPNLNPVTKFFLN